MAWVKVCVGYEFGLVVAHGVAFGAGYGFGVDMG